MLSQYWGAAPEISSQAKGSLARDRAAAGDDRGHAVRRHANLLRQPVHADAQVFQRFLENLARMHGWQLIGSVS